jgi:hypothetical protein
MHHNVAVNLFSRDYLNRCNQNNSKYKGGECQINWCNWGAPGSLSCNKAIQTSGPTVTGTLCGVLCRSAQELRPLAWAPLLWIHTHISNQTSSPLQGYIAVIGVDMTTIKIKIWSLSTAMDVLLDTQTPLSRKGWDTAEDIHSESKMSEGEKNKCS